MPERAGHQFGNYQLRRIGHLAQPQCCSAILVVAHDPASVLNARGALESARCAARGDHD
jgi:hypothetical protein